MIDPDWSSTILSKVEIKEDLPAPVLPTIPTWGGFRIFDSGKFLENLYIWYSPQFPPGEGEECLVLEYFWEIVNLVLPTIPTWGGSSIFGSGIFQRNRISFRKVFQELRFFGVILVNKSLKALCLSSKMVYQQILHLLSLWTYWQVYPRSNSFFHCKFSRVLNDQLHIWSTIGSNSSVTNTRILDNQYSQSPCFRRQVVR